MTGARPEVCLVKQESEEKEPEQYKLGNSIQTILKLAVMPIIGMLFHPLYIMVNAAFVGHMDDHVNLAGLGLGSLTCGIMLISFGTSFALVTGSLIAPAFGAGDVRFCRVILNR